MATGGGGAGGRGRERRPSTWSWHARSTPRCSARPLTPTQISTTWLGRSTSGRPTCAPMRRSQRSASCRRPTASAILAELFDDDELRAALGVEHDTCGGRRRPRPRPPRTGRRRARRRRARHAGGARGSRARARPVPARRRAAAIPLGPASAVCARRLVLRATGEDAAGLVVVDDEFNPARGLFVTPTTTRRCGATSASSRTRTCASARPGRVGSSPSCVRAVASTSSGRRRRRAAAGCTPATRPSTRLSLFTDAPS